MTGVIYARYSSDNQREESIEGQIRENTAFAEKNGITIVGHYIDRAYSAKTDNRPEFQRMIRDSAKKTFDVVIVWKLDRFSRNRYDSAKYKAALKKNDVRVISATEAISEGAEGIILESVLEGMAEYYSADLAEKVTRGMTENALKCRFNGGNGLPYGYTVDEEKHFQIDPLKAPIVAEIFERYAHGESIVEIINDLNNRGLKTQHGKEFNHGTLNRMFTNKSYMGVYHYNGIEIPGGVPAIVSAETFEIVGQRMAKNKRAAAKNKAKEKYILTTKLFCGKCHTMMVADSAQKKNGNTYRYYKCASAKRHECDKKAVRKEWIEELVLNKVIKVLFDDEALDKIADKIVALLDEDNKVIPLLEAQLKEVRKSIDNVMKAIEAGIITRSTKAKLEQLEAEEEQIEQNILKEQTSTPKLTKEQILFVLDKFRKLDLTLERNRERLIDSLVKCVLLYDDKLVITLNYKNEPITLPTTDELDEVEKFSDIKSFASPTKKERHSLWVSFFFCLCSAQTRTHLRFVCTCKLEENIRAQGVRTPRREALKVLR